MAAMVHLPAATVIPAEAAGLHRRGKTAIRERSAQVLAEMAPPSTEPLMPEVVEVAQVLDRQAQAETEVVARVQYPATQRAEWQIGEAVEAAEPGLAEHQREETVVLALSFFDISEDNVRLAAPSLRTAHTPSIRSRHPEPSPLFRKETRWHTLQESTSRAK